VSSEQLAVSSERLKIGVFDSGLGGLTVVQAMMETIKGAEIFYLADTKHAPYGEKSKDEIIRYALEITDYFIQTYHIDALVVACNTATTAAIHVLRQRYPSLIIVGTEPGIKPAIEKTCSGKVGILATPATLKSEKYQALLERLASSEMFELYEQACPGLVEQIENDRLHSKESQQMLEAWLGPMKKAGVDTIVLGCTHYPLAVEKMKQIMGEGVLFVDTGEAIARRLRMLAIKAGHNDSGTVALTLLSTGKISTSLVSCILGRPVTIRQITLDAT